MVRPSVQHVEQLALQLEPPDRRVLVQRLASSLPAQEGRADLDQLFAEMDRIRVGSRLNGLSLRSIIDEGRQ